MPGNKHAFGLRQHSLDDGSEASGMAVKNEAQVMDSALSNNIVVDDFERGNLDPYTTGDVLAFDIVTDPNIVHEGGFSMRGTGDNSAAIGSPATAGLPKYPSLGDTIRFIANFEVRGFIQVSPFDTGDGNKCGEAVSLSTTTNEFGLRDYNTDVALTTVANGVDVGPTYVIDYESTEAGDVTARLRDADLNEITSVAAGGHAVSADGICWAVRGGGTVVFDSMEIVP